MKIEEDYVFTPTFRDFVNDSFVIKKSSITSDQKVVFRNDQLIRASVKNIIFVSKKTRRLSLDVQQNDDEIGFVFDCIKIANTVTNLIYFPKLKKYCFCYVKSSSVLSFSNGNTYGSDLTYSDKVMLDTLIEAFIKK
jgi:hypothetical protein